MQHHAADQLHVEVAHVEHPAAGFADHRESFDQNLIQRFVDNFYALIFEFLQAIGIGLRFVRKASQTLLDTFPELIRFGAQLVVRKLPASAAQAH